MMTLCNRNRLHFQGHRRREVVAQFDGGMITSDAGGLLLREVNESFGVIRKFASCFRDHRDPELIEHPVEQLLGQRVMGIALGYEDLNDHDELRHDPLMALLSGRDDLTGRKRRRERDRGENTKKRVARDYSVWIKDNPNGTIGDLLARLLVALDQCRDMASATNDARIEDCWENIPEPLISQLADWDNSEEECTFSYREANIEAHVGDVEELVDEFGEDFKAVDLAK